jgi:hypothetical protein
MYGLAHTKTTPTSVPTTPHLILVSCIRGVQGPWQLMSDMGFLLPLGEIAAVGFPAGSACRGVGDRSMGADANCSDSEAGSTGTPETFT